ncbi:MAG: DUF3473 domain-containing protein [Phycisphaerae bacterium]|nr:DUF3473 domain-containing protein [Phycisphaerae bacterium]
MLNALTIDFEDWMQANIDPDRPITPRVVGNVRRVLSLLDEHQVKATFFILGKVGDLYPDLVREVDQAGHEIASHGWSHRLVYNLSPEQFRQDLRRSIEQLVTLTGRPPLGYRAPAFSITKRSLWAVPILADEGFRYSSSVFPIRKKRYGIPDAPRYPYRWEGCDLIEFPLTTARFAGWNVPVCGGGYLRLFPYAVVRRALRAANRAGQPAVVYFHPYEFDLREVRELQAQGHAIGRKDALMKSLWRAKLEGRLRAALDEFEFAPMARVLEIS